ncbi:hypothetical protein ACOMHN_048063 [Nucella lapillus]
MSSGVFAILGQKDIATTDIVRSVTSTFHMPYITPSPAPPRRRKALSYELHVRPDNTGAIVDVIRHFKWRHIHYLYDSDEGLLRLQQIFRALGNESSNWFFVSRFQDVTNVHEQLRAIDASSSTLPFKSIVLDLSSDEAYEHVLRQTFGILGVVVEPTNQDMNDIVCDLSTRMPLGNEMGLGGGDS